MLMENVFFFRQIWQWSRMRRDGKADFERFGRLRMEHKRLERDRGDSSCMFQGILSCCRCDDKIHLKREFFSKINKKNPRILLGFQLELLSTFHQSQL